MSISACFASAGTIPRLLSTRNKGATQQPEGEQYHPLAIQYMNEGGANFVFRFAPYDSPELPPALSGKLLRLRKDLPHLPTVQQQYDDFNDHIRPLIAQEHLVQQDLIELDPALVREIDVLLEGLDHGSRRKGHALPLDEHLGLLITDMTPQSASEKLLELKPKWLLQSPSAPAAARRCRTCALRGQRAAAKTTTATDAQENCPFALISSDEGDRRATAQRLTQDDALVRYLVHDAQELLRALREQQRRLDVAGSLSLAATDHDGMPPDQRARLLDLCKAMTLRDCTVFLRHTGAGGVEARLADLDLKRPDKLGRWQEIERSLIDGGWYTDAERETVCLLARPNA